MVECQTILEQLRESNPAHTIAKWTPLLDNIAGRVQVLEHQVGYGNEEKNLVAQSQIANLQNMLQNALERLAVLESSGNSKEAKDGLGLMLTPVHEFSSPPAGRTTRQPQPPTEPQTTANISNAFGMRCSLPDPPSHILMYSPWGRFWDPSPIWTLFLSKPVDLGSPWFGRVVVSHFHKDKTPPPPHW